MTTYDDVMALESGDFETAEDQACAMQRLINDGAAWSLQGSFGRAMMDAIRAGACMLGKSPTRDAYGNGIPSRDQAALGTMGTRAYVVQHRGEAWAAMLEQQP